MNKVILSICSVFLVYAFFIALSTTGHAQEVEGSVICIEVDEEGNAVSKTEYTVCKGTLIVVGKDGKSYVMQATEEEMKTMTMEKKTVSGEISGHTRGWILGSAAAKALPAEEATVTGTIVCLLPNYEAGTVKPVVATGPCTELTPHSHVITTKGGQVYALHGSEDVIKRIESSSDRTNVDIKGKVQGSQGAWVLFAE